MVDLLFSTLARQSLGTDRNTNTKQARLYEKAEPKKVWLQEVAEPIPLFVNLALQFVSVKLEGKQGY